MFSAAACRTLASHYARLGAPLTSPCCLSPACLLPACRMRLPAPLLRPEAAFTDAMGGLRDEVRRAARRALHSPAARRQSARNEQLQQTRLAVAHAAAAAAVAVRSPNALALVFLLRARAQVGCMAFNARGNLLAVGFKESGLVKVLAYPNMRQLLEFKCVVTVFESALH